MIKIAKSGQQQHVRRRARCENNFPLFSFLESVQACFELRHSSFELRHSSFELRHSSFGLRIPRAWLIVLLGFVAGCAAPRDATPPAVAPLKSWSGQLHHTSAGRAQIGDVALVVRDAGGFDLDFTSGPGVPLLRLQRRGDQVAMQGILVRGAWRGDIARAPEPLRSWPLLAGVFQQIAQGKPALGPAAAVPARDLWKATMRLEATTVVVRVEFAARGQTFTFRLAR